jgi:hexokinase
MDISRMVYSFLRDHGMSADDVDMDEVCKNMLSEMESGLKGKKSSLEMIPTYVDVPVRIPPLEPVMVLDAGGTHFRSGLASFTESGEFRISSFSKISMPGTETYLSKDEFFLAVADVVRSIADRSDRIGFCFSYPTEIYPNRDGRLIRFVKEIKAPEVEGELIGENLLAALGVKKRIVILNDTVATLLAGKVAETARSYSGYIGFILGTGMNGSYVESRSNIDKLKVKQKDQIINTELGNFSRLNRGVIDIELDKGTVNPGVNSFEKMISGGYLGDLVLNTLKKAADKGVIKDKIARRLDAVSKIKTKDLNDLLCSPRGKSPLADILDGGSNEDNEAIHYMVSSLVERAAKLSAVAISALCLKSGAGYSASMPICVTVEGTTFYRLTNLRKLTLFYLKHYLTDQKGIHADVISVEDATIKGAAIAGLS